MKEKNKMVAIPSCMYDDKHSSLQYQPYDCII